MKNTQGHVIGAARKFKKMTLEDLGSAIGMSRSNLSMIENDLLKNGVDPRTLIRIADLLDAPEILMHHCEACPIRQHIMMKQFPDLNNIRTEPSIIANRLRQEMIEGAAAADELSQLYAHKDFQTLPEFQARHKALHEQIVDAERAMEILKFELIRLGALTREEHNEIVANQQTKCEEHNEIVANQQTKCEEHGHHIPDKAA